MKIAFIGQKGIPAKFGGVEKHVEDLATRLVNHGHEVSVYTRPNYTDSKLREYEGVRLISLRSFSTKHLDAISHTFFAILDAVRRDFDVIHFHSIGPSSLIWLFKFLKPNTPIVATFHTQCYEHQKWGRLAKTYLKFGEAMICRLPNKTLAVSKSLANYARYVHKCDAVYVPNGVPVAEYYDGQIITKWGLKKGNYLLAVSRLVRHKGIKYLVEAYQKLNTDKKLVIVGDGTYTDDYVKEMKELAVNNKNIIFTGNQTGRALKELFSNAYVFVQPSESEGLSIALLEAMSYGLPVLVSDIPENIEAMGEAGFTFKNKDGINLSRQLEMLLNAPDDLRMIGEWAKERVKTEYNWEKITESVESIYFDVVGSKASSDNKLRVLKFLKRA